jgi:hypothetical protein
MSLPAAAPTPTLDRLLVFAGDFPTSPEIEEPAKLEALTLSESGLEGWYWTDMFERL